MHEVTAYIGLGSNLAGPQSNLSSAMSSLQQLPQTELTRYSSYYISKPLGPQDQPDFVNAVAEIRTSLDPMILLEQLLKIESDHGRVRGEQRWGPRTLDLDLLLYGSEEVNEKTLTIPHPEMTRRHFVLGPLAELAPTLRIPGLGIVLDLFKKVDDGSLRVIEQDG